MRAGGQYVMRGRVVTFVLVVLLAAVLAACGSGAATTASHPVSSPSPLSHQLDAYFGGLVAAQRFSGSVLIARGGDVVLSQGYGFADTTQRIPNTPATQFRIASLTKQFTAAAILLLQARGKLHLGDPICRYIASCPQAWQPITVQELLTHTSGIPDLADNDIADYTKPLTSQQLLALIRAQPLAFAPGTKFQYSSAGYNVLGVIVEQVSGEPYATFVQQEIFTPLGLASTRYDASAIQLPAHATGYTTWGSPAPYLDMTLPFAAGALASTVGDLDRWSRALDGQTLLGADATADMFAAHVALCTADAHNCPGTFTTLGYGYGWYVGVDALGRIEYHVGDLLGFRALIARYPDRDLTVVVLSNLESSDVEAIRTSIEGMLAASG